MEEAWLRLLAPFGCPDGACRAAFVDLVGRYASPGRYYHTLEHIAFVLEQVASLCAEADDRPALLLACWFHDVVYDSRASDNEERSAAHGRSVLEALGVPGKVVDEMARLVLLTKTHRTEEDDTDGRVLLDADLAVLGADEPVYDRYARAIRQEYAWVAESDYRDGRRSVLEGFLRRPRLYLTESMFARAEDRARSNLAREIGELSHPPPPIV